MASHFKAPISRFGHFGPLHAEFSDTVIGTVLPRGRGRDHFADEVAASRSPVKAPTERVESAKAEKERLLEAKKAHRREQLRASQARFRQKQRDLRRQQDQALQSAIQQFQYEIQALKLERKRLKLRGKTKPSPWRIVSEVFHLINLGFQSPWCVVNAEQMKRNTDTKRCLAFLQTVLVPGVAMGQAREFDALVEQLKRYALNFGDPNLELGRIESVAPGVLSATATLSVTITDETIASVFPLLRGSKDINDGDNPRRSLRGRLVGHRVQCSCTMSFLLDEESGCVERIQPNLELLPSFIRLLGVEDAVTVLDQSLITSEGLVGKLESM